MANVRAQTRKRKFHQSTEDAVTPKRLHSKSVEDSDEESKTLSDADTDDRAMDEKDDAPAPIVVCFTLNKDKKPKKADLSPLTLEGISVPLDPATNKKMFAKHFGVKYISEEGFETKYTSNGSLRVSTINQLVANGVPVAMASGVVNTVPIKRGDRVFGYLGELLSELPENTDFVFRLEIDGKVLFVDARKKGNGARFVNHSDTPNLYCDIHNGRPGYYAAEDIPAGSHLTINYHATYKFNYAPIALGSRHTDATPQAVFVAAQTEYQNVSLYKAVLQCIRTRLGDVATDLVFVPRAVSVIGAADKRLLKDADVDALIFAGTQNKKKENFVLAKQVELTALMVACLCNDIDSAEALLKQKANPNLFALDTLETPLHMIIKRSDLSETQKLAWMKLLTKHGAVVNPRDSAGLTVIDYCIKQKLYHCLAAAKDGYNSELTCFIDGSPLRKAMAAKDYTALCILIRQFTPDGLASELVASMEDKEAKLRTDGEALRKIIPKMPKEVRTELVEVLTAKFNSKAELRLYAAAVIPKRYQLNQEVAKCLGTGGDNMGFHSKSADQDGSQRRRASVNYSVLENGRSGYGLFGHRVGAGSDDQDGPRLAVPSSRRGNRM